MSRRVETGAVGALIALFLVLSLSSAQRKSLTVDEYAHIPAGLRALGELDFSVYNKTPPAGRMLVTLPALPFVLRSVPASAPLTMHGPWLPWRQAELFYRLNQKNQARIVMAARTGAVLCGAGLIAGVWLWSRKNFGAAGGLITAGAAALSPNLIAHARLAGTDVVAAFFMLGFFVGVSRYLERPSLSRAAIMGGGLGLGVVAKFSALFFAPFALATPLLAWAVAKSPAGPGRQGPGAVAAQVAAVAAAAWLAILGGYLFQDISFHGKRPYASKAMKSAGPALGLVPLPADFVDGLDRQLYDAQMSEFESGNYLLGERYQGSRPYYYLVALAAKTPVPLLVLGIAAVALAAFRRPARWPDLWLVAMAGAFLVGASLFSSLQIGARYLLMVSPVIYYLSGAVGGWAFSVGPEDLGERGQGPAPEISRQRRVRRAARAFLFVGLAWLVADDVMIWPDYLAYFSPLAGGPDNGYKILADSNLDWGQDLPSLKSWMDEHGAGRIELAYFGHDDPARFGIDYALPGRDPSARYIAISATLLTGARYPMFFSAETVAKDDPLWHIIRSYRGRDPVGSAGYSILIFDRLGQGAAP